MKRKEKNSEETKKETSCLVADYMLHLLSYLIYKTLQALSVAAQTLFQLLTNEREQ